MYSIDTGERCWRIFNKNDVVLPWVFYSEIAANHHIKNNGLADCTVKEHDTRISVSELADKLRKEESHVWDEYFSCGLEYKNAKMPEKVRWFSIYVVKGGSEGIYLHIDSISSDCVSETLIIAKTCSFGYDKWRECYESAGRISWAINC